MRSAPANRATVDPTRTPAGTAVRPEESPGKLALSGVLAGIGVAAFVDETFLHQLLHWHHFYDKSTPTVGLVSDGYFHAVGWAAVVVGLFLFADLQRRAATVPRRVWAGGLIGWGGFQLYDGLFQHKVLGLHQIRYHVNLLPYDLVWNIAGGIGLVVGLLLLRGHARSVAQRE